MLLKVPTIVNHLFSKSLLLRFRSSYIKKYLTVRVVWVCASRGPLPTRGHTRLLSFGLGFLLGSYKNQRRGGKKSARGGTLLGPPRSTSGARATKRTTKKKAATPSSPRVLFVLPCLSHAFSCTPGPGASSASPAAATAARAPAGPRPRGGAPRAARAAPSSRPPCACAARPSSPGRRRSPSSPR